MCDYSHTSTQRLTVSLPNVFLPKNIMDKPGGATPPGLSIIFLGRNTFGNGNINGQTLSAGMTIIAHEMAHILDFKDSGGNPELYKGSQFFINSLNKGNCPRGYLSCLGRNPTLLYKILNLLTGGGIGGYDSNGKPSNYGKDNGVADDFADSFAAYTLNRIGIKTPLIPYDQYRQMIIAAWITISSK